MCQPLQGGRPLVGRGEPSANKNAVLPVLTVVGLEFGTLLGGATLVEDPTLATSHLTLILGPGFTGIRPPTGTTSKADADTKRGSGAAPTKPKPKPPPTPKIRAAKPGDAEVLTQLIRYLGHEIDEKSVRKNIKTLAKLKEEPLVATLESQLDAAAEFSWSRA